MRKIAIASAASFALALGLATSALAQDTATPPAEQSAQATMETSPTAETAPSAETAPAAVDPAAPAAGAPTEAVPAAPGEEPGRIVFFRPSRLTGGAWAYTIAEVGEDGHVDEDDPRIGRLPNGSYFIHEAQPGIHNYNITGPMAVNLAEDRLRLEVEPGQTYYVEQTVRMGILTGGFRLVPSDQASFERRRLRESVPRPENE